MLRAIAVAIVLAGTPSVAYPCGNEVELTRDEYIKLVNKAEKALEAGEFKRAERTLAGVRIPDVKLASRAHDVRKLVALRTRTAKTDVKSIVEHFKERVEKPATKGDVRFQAWLAEALEASGDEAGARTILADLKKRDLMPDGYAYLTLAKLSSGEERAIALAACEARMKTKAQCTLPAKKVSTKS